MKKFNNNLVIQSNQLIEARFTVHMTEQEQKTLAFIISETKKSDVDLYLNNQSKIIEISAKDFADIMKTDIKHIYRDAENLSHNLMRKSLKFKYIGDDGKEAFKEIVMVTTVKYDSGILTIKVNADILPFLVELKERFTAFRLENVLRLGSGYAIKVYQLLKQYETINNRVFTIDELKDILAITNMKSYNKYNNFKIDVLEVSKKHINLYTDIQIEYEEIKLGRKVHKVMFYIKSKINQEQQAKMAFEIYVKSLSGNHQLKYMWEQTNSEHKWERFNNEFNNWITKNLFYYEPQSCDSLQYFEEGTLFFNN